MLFALTLAACPILCQEPADPLFVEHLIAEMPAGIELADEPPGELAIAVRLTRSVGFDAGESHRVGWTGDGRSVAYVGQRGAELVPVFGHRVGEPRDDVFAPTVGPRAGDVAFRCVQGSFENVRWLLVRDEGKAVEYRWIGTPAFSPDGETLVYWSEPFDVRPPRGSKLEHPFVLQGLAKNSQPFRRVERFVPPTFSADGGSVFVIAVFEEAWAVLRYTKSKPRAMGTASAGLVSLVSSPDGMSWAFSGDYAHRIQGKDRNRVTTMMYRCVIRDDVRFGAGAFDSSGPVFSPDGQRVAHRVHLHDNNRRRTDYGVGIDGEPGGPPSHAYVTQPVWSSDSKSIAYVTSTSIALEAHPRPCACRRMDAAERGGGDQVFVWDIGGEPEAVSDPKERIEKVTFAPDGERLAWAERRKGKWWVVCGEHAAGPYDEVGPLRFDGEGRRIAFGTREERSFWWRVLDV